MKTRRKTTLVMTTNKATAVQSLSQVPSEAQATVPLSTQEQLVKEGD